MKVSINLVTWNSRKFIADVLKSIFEQSLFFSLPQSIDVLVIDNGSRDGTVEFIQENYPQAALLRNANNRGFAAAHNQGIKFAKSRWRAIDENEEKYILVINPDIILTPDCLKILIEAMEQNPRAGSAGGKLFKLLESKEGSSEKIKSNIIDSCSLKILKSRQAVERGAGEVDSEKYNLRQEVFGISGALALYRLSALEDTKIYDEYFDESFFAYKEDVDLAWRMRMAGWKSLYLPVAKAYHFRQVFALPSGSLRERIRAEKKKSPLVKYYSYKNHYAVCLKNDFFSNYLLHLPHIFFYELKKFLYILFFDRAIFKAIFGFFAEFGAILKKRRIIMRNRRVSAREMRRWLR